MKGKVLGYIALHRHGHRAPIRNLFEANELKFWLDLLPAQDRLSTLSNSFPVQQHDQAISPIDLKYKPLSCLTNQGVDYMISVGEKTARNFPMMSKSEKFQVFSTNYHRTQASAQSFLTGLGAKNGTRVEVRKPAECTLSFYEGRPEIAKRVTTKVQEYEEFQNDEMESIGSIGKSITKILPTLSVPGSTSSPDGSNINWMAALDYFTCREGHSLPIDQRIQHLRDPVINYVSRRYRAYYTDPEHRSHSINPLLTNINTIFSSYQSEWINQQNRNTSSVPLGTVLFSGHDVNILGLLHGLNATLLDPSREDQGGHWPDFGSLLVFELISNNNDSQDIAVNISYNHEPLMMKFKDTIVTSIPFNEWKSLIREYP